MTQEYILTYFESYNDVYKGKDEYGYSFIAIESSDSGSNTYSQKSKELLFRYNVDCNIIINEISKNSKLHILTCASLERKHIINFERLISAFLKTDNYKSSEKISDLFSVFLSMFSKPKKRSFEEIEGFFCELYFMLFMRRNGLDVSIFWQSKDKMKFDFTFDSKKRTDVKSTIKTNRIHHFLHEQLASDIYDIHIISMLMRTSDSGLSVNNVIELLNSYGQLPLSAEKLIQSFISNTENSDDLDDIKFDELYLQNNLQIFNANIIPKFNCKQPNGVTKTEYDSDLSGCSTISVEDYIDWINT